MDPNRFTIAWSAILPKGLLSVSHKCISMDIRLDFKFLLFKTNNQLKKKNMGGRLIEHFCIWMQQCHTKLLKIGHGHGMWGPTFASCIVVNLQHIIVHSYWEVQLCKHRPNWSLRTNKHIKEIEHQIGPDTSKY